ISAAKEEGKRPRDIEVIEAELIFKDLDTVEKKLADARKRAKTGDKKTKAEADFYERVRDHLLSGRLARYLSIDSDDERFWLRDMHLLTSKPVMYVCNVHENDLSEENAYVHAVREIAAREGAKVVAASAAVEAEVAELPVRPSSSYNLLHRRFQRSTRLDSCQRDNSSRSSGCGPFRL
ncbi:MAG: hypothetical protein AAB393_02035, partial [Bacteroidota bacterium]